MLTLLSVALAGGVDRVPEDFATLQQAVEEGQGTVIELGPGRWAGARVDRAVTVRGLPGAIIDQGVDNGRLAVGIWLVDGADGSVVEGVTFDCHSQVDAGVYSSARRGGVVRGVEVVGNDFDGCVQGVTVAGARSTPPGDVSWTVVGNRFAGLSAEPLRGGSGGAIGVFAFNVGGVDVVDNRFDGWVREAGFASAGVVVAGCEGCGVVGNRFAMDGDVRGHAAVVDAGGRLAGAGVSRDLVLADNDAVDGAAPWRGTHFRVERGDEVLVEGNEGRVWVRSDGH